MPSVREILSAVEAIAPPHCAWDDDRIGLMVGDPSDPVTTAIVTFDASLAAFDYAASVGAQLVVAHHPVLWNVPKRLVPGDYTARRALSLIQRGIACIAAHTNWDACPDGLNDFLAERLGLIDVAACGSFGDRGVYKVVFYTPEGTEGPIIDAMSQAGAGQIGLYRRCAFASPGTGQFEPVDGSTPHVGTVGNLHFEPELRVEMIVPGTVREAVQCALVKAHPYEEPAFEFLKIEGTYGQPLSRVGTLPSPMTVSEFGDHVSTSLGTAVRLWGQPTTIQRVAVCGGAGDSEWQAARLAGADVLVTGEVKQHVALEASETGFSIVEAGHYATEHYSMQRLLDKLQEAVPGVTWSLFTPDAGQAGRPIEFLCRD